MSRHRSGRKWRRRDLLAEIARLNGIVATLQADRARMLREVASPGSEDETMYVPMVKLVHTDGVKLITPDGKATTARTGARPRPSWAREDHVND